VGIGISSKLEYTLMSEVSTRVTPETSIVEAEAEVEVEADILNVYGKGML
jgi:hypothetical protein